MISNKTINQIKWKSRRGVLENDLIFKKFLIKYKNKLNHKLTRGLIFILNLNDYDITNLIFLNKKIKKKMNKYTLKIINILRSLKIKNKFKNETQKKK